MGRTPTRKKPCRVCRRWFLPDVRLKQPDSVSIILRVHAQWHNNKCAQWYRANIDYFKANYLQKKIDAVEGDVPLPTDTPKPDPMKVTRSRMKSGLPVAYVQEWVGVKHTVIIEYLAQQLHQRRWRAPP